MGQDKDDEVEDDSLEPISRCDALLVTIILNNFLIQDEKTTLVLFYTLRKIKDEIQEDINFKKKQLILELYLP